MMEFARTLALCIVVSNWGGAFCSDCGIPGGLSENRVLGGETVEGSGIHYPWYVGLAIRPALSQGRLKMPRIACGGALISSTHVLTAAHCFNSNSRMDHARKFLVTYMVEDPCHQKWRTDGPQAYRVHIHPDYDSESYDNDIAIITLDGQVPYMRICLPNRRIPVVKDKASVIGYGSTVERLLYPCQLQEGDVELIPREECLRTSVGAVIKDQPNVLCAGYIEGGVDSCDGDSGGPLQVQGPDGRYTIRGVVSFGVGCGKENYPGIYTDVSAYTGWIQRHITSVDSRLYGWLAYVRRLAEYKEMLRRPLQRPAA